MATKNQSPSTELHESRLDRLLDRSVALGYSRIGYAIRSRTWSDDLHPGMLTGRSVLLTGGTAGIGKAAAQRLGELGATVHLVGHGRDRARQAERDLRAAVPGGEFVVHLCDMSDLDAVRALADSVREQAGPLHALLHNAGTMATRRTESPQGHELTLAVQVLGPFLLTQWLSPTLADGGRVVFMSSGGMYGQPVVLDDLEHHHAYSGTKAYARTKRMLVELTSRWDRTLPAGVTAHSMHPGWVDTPGVATFLPKFRAMTRPVMRNAEQGADTLVWLAAAAQPARQGGRFWHDRRPRPTAYAGRNRTSQSGRDRLWDYCVQATGG